MATEGLRPILAQDTPPKLAELLEAAWRLQPAERPAAAHLEAELRALLQQLDAATPSAVPDHSSSAGANGLLNGTGWVTLVSLTSSVLPQSASPLLRQMDGAHPVVNPSITPMYSHSAPFQNA